MDGTRQATATDRTQLLEEGTAFAELSRLRVDQERKRSSSDVERHEVVVIGGGQAGLSVGYHLARRGVPFVILDASPRIGDAWRERWDSLRLFTPRRYDALDGMPFPGAANDFPTKDEMADYLEAYAARHHLPVRTGTRVQRLTRRDDRYVVETNDRNLEAGQVVVAMSSYQKPVTPAFAGELDPHITQLHSAHYRRPSQLPAGDVLIVGAGNSALGCAASSFRSSSASCSTGSSPSTRPSGVRRVRSSSSEECPSSAPARRTWRLPA
jgi:putative flavoprotein involved in K+ transport